MQKSARSTVRTNLASRLWQSASNVVVPMGTRQLCRVLIGIENGPGDHNGSNTAESHPVLATRVNRAHKLRGQKLIVSDLREHEMAKRADLFLHLSQNRHGWLSAVSRYLWTTVWRYQFLDQWEWTGRIQKSLAPFTMVCRADCGLRDL